MIIATYILVYARYPWPVKLALLTPWSVFSAIALGSIEHYTNHWPPFRSEIVNALWRIGGVLIFTTPLENRYRHREHHRLNNALIDPVTTLESAHRHKSVWSFVVKDALLYAWHSAPWAPLHPLVRALKDVRPSYYREVIIVRWLCAAWVVGLLIVDHHNTLCFFLPITLFFYPLAWNTMSLAEHLPGDPSHAFRVATYFEPTSAWERLLCLAGHHTASTHLTHHLFPHVHWALLPRLQCRLARHYRAFDSPLSITCNSIVLGNPLRLLTVWMAASRRRAIWRAGEVAERPDCFEASTCS